MRKAKRRIILSLLLGILLITGVMFAAADEPAGIKVIFNGEEVVFAEKETAPYFQNYNLMVSMDTMIEKLNITLTERPELKTYECDRDPDKVTFMLGNDVLSQTVGVDGNRHHMEILKMKAVPEIKGESVMIPLQSIIEALGGTYTWDESAKTANIVIAERVNAPKVIYDTMIEPVAIEVSAEGGQSGTAKEKVIDRDIATRWSAKLASNKTEPITPQWITFDLGEVKKIHGVGFTWFKGTRTYNFYVEVSNDNTNWTKVIADGVNVGKGDNDTETHGFAEIDARYVRVTVTYNSHSEPWAHITEMRVFGPEGIPTDELFMQ